jgi:hypothetical protein
MEPVRTLGREYSMEILGATERPKSATRLSRSLEIPIATCYRRVDELVSVGLLEECEPDGEDAPNATLYRRTSDAVGIRFAPTPSLFAWSCVRQAVGADASTIGVPAGSRRQGQANFAPVTSNEMDAEIAQREPPVEKDA